MTYLYIAVASLAFVIAGELITFELAEKHIGPAIVCTGLLGSFVIFWFHQGMII